MNYYAGSTHNKRIFSCLWNGEKCTRTASSKEHLLANKRLSLIKATNGKDEKVNDNIRKKYTHITCENCNNELGMYEAKSETNLAYATIWKLLALNYSGSSISTRDLQIKNAPLSVIESHLISLKKCIEANGIFQDQTFTFNYAIGAKVDPKFNQGIFKGTLNVTDKKGNPIEGVIVYVKTNGFHEGNEGLIESSDESGLVPIKILKHADYLQVFSNSICFVDRPSGLILERTIDWIVYICLNATTQRHLIAFPLLDEEVLPCFSMEIYESTLDSIHKEHFADLKISNLKSFRSLNAQKSTTAQQAT